MSCGVGALEDGGAIHIRDDYISMATREWLPPPAPSH